MWYFAGGGVILRSPCYLIVDLYLLRRLVSEHPKTSPGCCSLRGVLSYVGVFSNVGDDTTVLSPRAPMDASNENNMTKSSTRAHQETLTFTEGFSPICFLYDLEEFCRGGTYESKVLGVFLRAQQSHNKSL